MGAAQHYRRISMSLFLFLTVLQAIVAAALVGIILMQRSEGGGLGIGGSPTGMLGARGAADFMTRTTKILAIMFVVLSIALAAVAVETTGTDEITSTLDRNVAPAENDPLAGALAPSEQSETPTTPAPATEDDPLAGATE